MIEIQLNDTGEKHRFKKNLYDVVLVGLFYAKNQGDFRIEFKNLESGKTYSVRESSLQIREWISFQRAIRYGRVDIHESGEYLIRVRGLEDLKTDKTMLHLQRWLFPSPVHPENIKVLIR